jgi:hypothetical protein
MAPARALASLRLGLGVIWALNLLYIVDPRNRFLTTFAPTVQTATSPVAGGPEFVAFVSAEPIAFALATAALTAFLAVAFLAGVAVRAACLAGGAFNAALLWLQLGSLLAVPGGTDVGPHPLYLVAYAALWIASAPAPRESEAGPRPLAGGFRRGVGRLAPMLRRLRFGTRSRGVRAEATTPDPTGR